MGGHIDRKIGGTFVNTWRRALEGQTNRQMVAWVIGTCKSDKNVWQVELLKDFGG